MKHVAKIFIALLTSVITHNASLAITEFKLSEIKNNTNEPLILKINKGYQTENLHIPRGTTVKPNLSVLLKNQLEDQNTKTNRDHIEIWNPKKRLFALQVQRNQNGELVTTQVNLSKFQNGREDQKIAKWAHKFLTPNVENDIYKVGLAFESKEGEILPMSDRLSVKLIED